MIQSAKEYKKTNSAQSLRKFNIDLYAFIAKFTMYELHVFKLTNTKKIILKINRAL